MEKESNRIIELKAKIEEKKKERERILKKLDAEI
jgi:hypothetical protein